jgi:hypothetical protein
MVDFITRRKFYLGESSVFPFALSRLALSTKVKMEHAAPLLTRVEPEKVTAVLLTDGASRHRKKLKTSR